MYESVSLPVNALIKGINIVATVVIHQQMNWRLYLRYLLSKADIIISSCIRQYTVIEHHQLLK